MRLFDKFSLSNGDQTIGEKELHSNKLVRLLVYILLHRERNVPHQELVDIFWEDERSKNPEGALKNLVYRLRVQLRVLGDQDFIMTLPGAYRWNPKVPVEVDCEQFERIARAARSQPDGEGRYRLCSQAVELYQKDVLPCLASEGWMASILTYYRILYTETVHMLGAYYERSGQWDNMETLCQGALKVDPLDEDMGYWLIKSQIGKNNFETAMQYYNNAKKTFYDNLGLRQVERFDRVYEEILAMVNNKQSDIGGLLGSVCEDEMPKEAFVCEYPVFREIYRMEARRMKRTGIAEYLLLITVKKTGSARSDVADDSIKAGMQILETLLKKTLRVGDVAARYSTVQYVLLLPNCDYESALIVAERIEGKFRSAAGKRRLMLHFEMEELSSADGDCKVVRKL